MLQAIVLTVIALSSLGMFYYGITNNSNLITAIGVSLLIYLFIKPNNKLRDYLTYFLKQIRRTLNNTLYVIILTVIVLSSLGTVYYRIINDRNLLTVTGGSLLLYVVIKPANQIKDYLVYFLGQTGRVLNLLIHFLGQIQGALYRLIYFLGWTRGALNRPTN